MSVNLFVGCGSGGSLPGSPAIPNTSGTDSEPALSISLANETFSKGTTVVGTVSISAAASVPVTVQLATNSPTIVSVAPSAVTIANGQSSIQFNVTGLGSGSGQISASAPNYNTVSVGFTSIDVPPPTTLRTAAALHRNLLMGAAADADEFGYIDPLTTDPQYASTLGTQYSMLEPESGMKWIVTEPAQDTFNFQPGDELVSFAQAHGMVVRGHNLAWNLSNPDWINDLAATGSTTAMATALHNHINTVMQHYKGQVFAWDVVNEAIDDNATGVGTQMKDSIWYDQPGIGLSGTGYVEQAFRWAHEADPNALLFYNDYNIYTPGPKTQALLNMLTDFIARGVPIHGVGLQMHLGTNGWPASSDLTAVISQITALGLQVHITEMDVQLPVDSNGNASTSDLQAQAATYQRILSVCLANTQCTAFQTWGFTDKHSWIPAAHPGVGAALPFDVNYQPKPAFYSLMDTLLSTP